MQVIEVVRHPIDKAESKYNPDAGVSKEDEERYQKLLCENEDLQRLIVQVSLNINKYNFKNKIIKCTNFYNLQKEDKIRMLRQRLIDRGGDGTKTGGAPAQSNAETTTISQTAVTSLSITAATGTQQQGKDALLVIQADPTTTSDFDSAIGGGISNYTRSSRASQSDFEFSESYLQ